MRLVEQEVAPRSEDGTSYSSEGLILVRSRTHRLVYRKSGKVWSGRGSPFRRTPTTLQIRELGDQWRAKIISLFEGGRLSLDRVRGKIEAIDAVFGSGATAAIDIRKTLVVGDAP